MTKFNPIKLLKRRKAAQELGIEARKYIGFNESLFDAMKKLYKDQWSEFAEKIVDGEKPTVVVEGIVYEFIVWIVENSLRGDEKGKATMRETIETSKLKDRLPLFHMIDSYIVSVLSDRIGLLQSLREQNCHLILR